MPLHAPVEDSRTAAVGRKRHLTLSPDPERGVNKHPRWGNIGEEELRAFVSSGEAADTTVAAPAEDGPERAPSKSVYRAGFVFDESSDEDVEDTDVAGGAAAPIAAVQLPPSTWNSGTSTAIRTSLGGGKGNLSSSARREELMTSRQDQPRSSASHLQLESDPQPVVVKGDVSQPPPPSPFDPQAKRPPPEPVEVGTRGPDQSVQQNPDGRAAESRVISNDPFFGMKRPARLEQERKAVTLTGALWTQGNLGDKEATKISPLNNEPRLRSGFHALIRQHASNGLVKIYDSLKRLTALYATEAQADAAADALAAAPFSLEGGEVKREVSRLGRPRKRQEIQMEKAQAKIERKLAKAAAKNSLLPTGAAMESTGPTEAAYSAIVRFVRRTPSDPIREDRWIEMKRLLPRRPNETELERLAALTCSNGDPAEPWEPEDRADRVFLRHIRDQKQHDPYRRAAIHEAEVAYTCGRVSDDEYNTLMFALLTPDERYERGIRNDMHAHRTEDPLHYRLALLQIVGTLFSLSEDEEGAEDYQEMSRADHDAIIRELGNPEIGEGERRKRRLPVAERDERATFYHDLGFTIGDVDPSPPPRAPSQAALPCSQPAPKSPTQLQQLNRTVTNGRREADGEADAMLSLYSQADSLGTDPSFLNGTSPTEDEDDYTPPSPTPVEVDAKMTLSTLSRPTGELQTRHNGLDDRYDDSHGPHPVNCEDCGRDHRDRHCPPVMCIDCGSPVGDGYVSLKRCKACGGRHVEKLSRFNPSTGPQRECDVCGREGHDGRFCDLLWRSLVPADTPRRVRGLPVSCYHCGKNSHYGAECPEAPLLALSGLRETFSQRNADRYLDPTSELLAPSLKMTVTAAAEQGPPPRRTTRSQGPTREIELDSDDDSANFFRPSIARLQQQQQQQRTHIRFGRGQRSQAQTRDAPRAEAYSHRPPPSQSGRGEPGSGRGGRGGNNSGSKGGRGSLKSTSGDRTRGRSEPRGGSGGGSAYRPMPSAGANAWKKHRI
ncbi:MAG: hypothetical protein M1832_002622 [Thelocarpon impressellum]|nr:MAG: hypothetical protein M1832_002622 [Thelocarpon impressellum]